MKEQCIFCCSVKETSFIFYMTLNLCGYRLQDNLGIKPSLQDTKKCILKLKINSFGRRFLGSEATSTLSDCRSAYRCAPHLEKTRFLKTKTIFLLIEMFCLILWRFSCTYFFVRTLRQKQLEYLGSFRTLEYNICCSSGQWNSDIFF